VFVIAFTGVRGAVSLAAALALPYVLANGEPFPNRDLILFVTFSLILVTLLGTGLLLPPLAHWLGVASDGASEHQAEHEAEIAARREALTKALQSLEAMTDDPEVSEEVIRLLRARHETRTSQLPASLEEREATALGAELTRELIGIERACIHTLLRNGRITDEARRRIERDLDLEEASLANREYRKIPL
jgi:NhaP-type Na+/H+ or K+/H+ antiporter